MNYSKFYSIFSDIDITPDTNWPKFIDRKAHNTVTQVKDMNPHNKKKYFNNLFDNNCDGFWKSYFEK